MKSQRCIIIPSCFGCKFSHEMVIENRWYCTQGGQKDYIEIPKDIIESRTVAQFCQLSKYEDMNLVYEGIADKIPILVSGMIGFGNVIKKDEHIKIFVQRINDHSS